MRSDTKHARILGMLRAPAGTTIAATMTATDWQPHSVRGFLASVVRKKLGLNLVSEQSDKSRLSVSISEDCVHGGRAYLAGRLRHTFHDIY